jgi:hypothetical protein
MPMAATARIRVSSGLTVLSRPIPIKFIWPGADAFRLAAARVAQTHEHLVRELQSIYLACRVLAKSRKSDARSPTRGQQLNDLQNITNILCRLENSDHNVANALSGFEGDHPLVSLLVVRNICRAVSVRVFAKKNLSVVFAIALATTIAPPPAHSDEIS